MQTPCGSLVTRSFKIGMPKFLTSTLFCSLRPTLASQHRQDWRIVPTPIGLAKKVTILSQWPLIHRPLGEPSRTFVYATLAFDALGEVLSIGLQLLGVAKHP